MSLIYGINPVKEALVSGKTINKLYLQKGNKDIKEILEIAKVKKIVTVFADKQKLDSMVSREENKKINAQGVVASITDFEYSSLDDLLEIAKSKNEEPFLVILDKIEDPHNLGAILRTIDCLGAHGCIIQKRNSCLVTDTVEKVAAGACSYVKVARVTNITEAIRYLKEKGLWIYGLDMEGAKDIYTAKLDGSIAIVIGNEGHGISRLVRENCDEIIKIPMSGNINSLNASVSAAITMYEIVRQKAKGI